MSADVVWCGCGDGIPPEELKCATCRMVDEANNERPPTVKEQAAVMALADDGYYQEAFEAEVALLAGLAIIAVVVAVLLLGRLLIVRDEA